jgi:hypothetical protein
MNTRFAESQLERVWSPIVPSSLRHSVKALADGRAIIVDYPLRDFD